MSTIPAVQVYIFGSVSPPGLHIILPRGTHHIYTHIDLVLLAFMKSGTFYMKTGTFCEKHLKST